MKERLWCHVVEVEGPGRTSLRMKYNLMKLHCPCPHSIKVSFWRINNEILNLQHLDLLSFIEAFPEIRDRLMKINVLNNRYLDNMN